MTQVAFLWHMHQPYYEDLVTREHILPWVRLHGLKDYFGMVALLKEFPGIRMTFNLVPSLLVQLEAFAAGRARDRYLEVGLKPAEELTPRDAAFILVNFFHAQRQRMIDPYPRYRELLALRGTAPPADPMAAARRFTVDDLRDLQVWQKLAWLDPIYLETEARTRALVAKGRGYTEEDKAVLRQIELELLNAVIPAYREASARGQVELSTSPFYHPILPLLCDTDIYKRTHPDSRLPRHRFVHPDDAREQLERAVACHQRLFGSRPEGLWPSEGSVSDAMVPLVAGAGFAWMATDELILARTLGLSFARDAAGQVDQPERLYKPYIVRAERSEVACVFRDHTLSDLIGFTYAGWNAEAAAQDFAGRLVEAGRRYAMRTGGGEAVIPVILDGENAWEHFEGGGRPFLRALYGRLSNHPELRTVTLGEAARHASDRLEEIFPGSWIDANFYIWIGHRDDHLAWSQLAEARDALDAPAADTAAAARAREEVLIAEGSDWFWWYGDDHSSEHDLEFDDLYRRHLRNVYRLLGKPVPDELFVSNITAGAPAPAEHPPAGLLSPTLDGEETSYFEWLGAGLFEVRDTAGAMHQAERREILLTLLQFGFDRERLFVRLDGVRPLIDLLAEGYEFSLKFLNPQGVRFSVRERLGRLTGVFWDRQATAPHWVERGPGGGMLAAGRILEMAVPLDDLRRAEWRSAAPTELSFFLAVYERDSEVERHPGHRPIEAHLPDDWFESRHWTA
jgi:alpha-amylase/alpha-mannosidase (GH57 family)